MGSLQGLQTRISTINALDELIIAYNIHCEDYVLHYRLQLTLPQRGGINLLVTTTRCRSSAIILELLAGFRFCPILCYSSVGAVQMLS